MTHVWIEIDGTVEFDGSITEWQRTPPDAFKDLIKPDSNPAPWMKAIMISMADAVMTSRSTRIVATTGKDVFGNDEWALKVNYK